MKKVRKEDLEDLITSFYYKFIVHISKDEYYYDLKTEKKNESRSKCKVYTYNS